MAAKRLAHLVGPGSTRVPCKCSRAAPANRPQLSPISLLAVSMVLRRATVQGLHAAGVQSALLSLRDWGASACADAARRHSCVRRYADISDPEFMRSTGLPVAERCKARSNSF